MKGQVDLTLHSLHCEHVGINSHCSFSPCEQG